MRVLFDGGLLEHVDASRTAKVITMLLRALVECNLDYLEDHPDTPIRIELEFDIDGKMEKSDGNRSRKLSRTAKETARTSRPISPRISRFMARAR